MTKINTDSGEFIKQQNVFLIEIMPYRKVMYLDAI